jgi:PHP family Zn ribbon phosphoesterase
MECQRCHSHFEASKSQAVCLDCCIQLGTATLITDKENKPKKFKPTKEKSIPLSEVKAMLSDAFDAGRYSKFDFEDWISRQDL